MVFWYYSITNFLIILGNIMFESKVEKAFGIDYCLVPFHNYSSHQGKLTIYNLYILPCVSLDCSWFMFFFFTIFLQNDLVSCTTMYWVLFCLQVKVKPLFDTHYFTISFIDTKFICRCCVSVSCSSIGFWIWSNEIVERKQEENDDREHWSHLWSFDSMEYIEHYILCTVWHLGWHRRGVAWFWWRLHFGSSAPGDWCHSTGNFCHFPANQITTLPVNIQFLHCWIINGKDRSESMAWSGINETGGKCNSDICDDVLIILICSGILFAQEVPHPLR